MVQVLSNHCPECKKGVVFRYFLLIEQRCSHCGFLYEREEGYFFGPMIISYFITLFLTLPVTLYLVFIVKQDLGVAFGVTLFQILVLGPILYRYAKLVWLHLETQFQKKIKSGGGSGPV